MKKILIAILLFCPTYARALTWGEMRTEIRVRIKDTDATRRRFSDTQLNNMMQAATRDIVTITRPIINQISITLVSGTTCYDIGSLATTPIIDIKRATFRGKSLPETTIEELDNKNGDSWRFTGGIPTLYYLPDIRITNICFYPFPNSSTSTGTATVDFFQGYQGNSVLSDSDEPMGTLNYKFQSYHDLVIWRVVADIYLLEDEMDKYQQYQTLYENRLALLRDNIWGKSNYIPGFSGQRQ